MHIQNKLLGLTTAAALFSSTAAFADVTAQDVWADWQGYMQSMGYSMDGTQSQSGDTLTISDVVMQMDLPNNEGSFNVTMGTMEFIENSDGSVSIVLPEVVPMVMTMTPKNGKTGTMKMDYTTSGLEMTVTGDPNDTTYTYSADALGINLTEFKTPDENLGSDFVTAKFALQNMSGVTTMKLGNLRDYRQSINAGSADYTMTFNVPEAEGGGGGTIAGNMGAFSFAGKGLLPVTINGTDPNAMIKAGFAFDGTFDYAGGSTNIDMDTPDGKVVGTTSSDGGKLLVAMSEAGLRYDVEQTNLKVNMQADSLPFPVALEMEQSAFNLTMPVLQNDQDQDFAFGFTMGNFTMSEDIWNEFDENAKLPRTPATLAIDLTGKAKMLLDIMDPANASNAQAPGELNALTINNIEVKAAGARLTGAGDFTFDNTDTVSFDGMPKPTGSTNLQLVGGNGLLNKLVEAEILPAEDAMGARMMMGMLAVPGEGEDTLKSTIEINGEGHVLVNGQRMR